MNGQNKLEALLRRDRTVVIAMLSLTILVSWLYVLAGAGMGMSAFDMSSLSMALGGPARDAASSGMVGGMEGGMVSGAMDAMATPMAWTASYAVLLFFMWWVMMVAMMLPSAAPMILLYALVARKAGERAGGASAEGRGGPWATATFTLGYLLAWAAFSALATALQWGFESAGLLSPMTMNSASLLFAGVILLFAGLYQVTPIKQACLVHCRMPVAFLSQHWRPGSAGALRMGLHHGAYCLGCCWGLMAILFFGGIMNLYWIVGLALIVLLEKVLPAGRGLSFVIGGLLMAWGLSFLYRAAL